MNFLRPTGSLSATWLKVGPMFSRKMPIYSQVVGKGAEVLSLEISSHN